MGMGGTAVGDIGCGLAAPVVWSGLVWSGLVWSGLVWSGLVWTGLCFIPPPPPQNFALPAARSNAIKPGSQ